VSLALYRRYRPETFEEVIGQEHVTGPLQQALRNQRINHAYLFSGPRGCGKTTSARILARCLNCEQGPTPTPCGQCKSCVGLARGAAGSIDVIEIDAASHGGVDDARDLRERAFFAPVESRFKIYILDEAHMVSSAGFNALLKVVEEPPPHLKFIFATTEPEKVIGTIRSRTHHYPFRLVPPGTLRDYLAKLCDQEGIKVEPEVLPLVVRAGAGSVRDSLSVMDQLLAGANEEGVSYPAAASLLGYTDAALLDEAVSALATRSGGAAFEIVDRVVEGGHDPRRFLGDLLERLRDLVILNAVPDAGTKGLITAPPDRLARMVEQASSFGQAELSRAADLANTGLTEMRGATAPRLLLELVFARILLPGGEDSARSLAARLERLERFGPPAGATAAPAAGYAAPDPAGSVGAAPVAPPQDPAGAGYSAEQAQPNQQQAPAGQPAGPSLAPPPWRTPPAAPASSAAPQQSPAAVAAAASAGGPPADVGMIRARWEEVLDRIRAQSRVAWTLVSADNAHVVGVEGRTIQLGFKNPTLRQNFPGSKYEDTLRQVLAQVFGGEWRVDVIVDPSVGHVGSGGSRSGSGSGPSQPTQTGPGGGYGGQQGGGGGGGGQQSGQWDAPAPPPVQQQPSPQQSSPQQQGQPPRPEYPSGAAASAPNQSAGAGFGQVPGGSGGFGGSGGSGGGVDAAMGASSAATATATMAPPAHAPAPEYSAPPEMAPVPGSPPPPNDYEYADYGPPPFVDEPSDEGFDPHLAALSDEAAPIAPGPSARDLLIKELGASIVDEIQNTD
jgi:DNA polymerase III subunit gamma/tau